MNDRRVTIFDPNRIFSDGFVNTFFSDMPSMSNTMEMEMFEDDNDVVFKIKAPGFKSKDIEISIEDKILTVSANVKVEEKEEDTKKKYYYRGIKTESFSKSVALPSSVKAEEAKAEFEDGILKITLPKMEEAKPKKIQIQAK